MMTMHHDEEWKQFMAAQERRQTGHLESIKTALWVLVGAAVLVLLIGVPLMVIA